MQHIFFVSKFNTAVKLISEYQGEQPFANYLKKYFSVEKKHGSKDRKIISHFCFSYYRTGIALDNINLNEKLLVAIFLQSNKNSEWNNIFPQHWMQYVNETFQKKEQFLLAEKIKFSGHKIFPFPNHLSKSIDSKVFSLSHLSQPDLFLRVRPGFKEAVLEKLQKHNIKFLVEDENCIRFSNAAKIDAFLSINKEVVVQDISSQKIAAFIKMANENAAIKTVWDCCAASGGKAILAADYLKNIELVVSDVRQTILYNLKKRFSEAGIKKFKSYIIDLTKPINKNIFYSNNLFDIVICDVPCSGSGTWGRTPEQLYFFKEKRINEYVQLQQKIISNAFSFVKQNGFFLYVTCSVFEEENEMQVNFIKQKFEVEVERMEIIKGYENFADTMFAALFKKRISTAAQ